MPKNHALWRPLIQFNNPNSGLKSVININTQNGQADPHFGSNGKLFFALQALGEKKIPITILDGELLAKWTVQDGYNLSLLNGHLQFTSPDQKQRFCEAVTQCLAGAASEVEKTKYQAALDFAQRCK